MRKAAGAALLALLLCSLPAAAHQWVITLGYANSGAPEHGDGVSDYLFASGGGYAFGTRVDLARENFWFGPEFSFWNNLTGDPQPGFNSSYFQVELGGRASIRTRTVPTIYGGVGAGYAISHAEFAPKHYYSAPGTEKETYDGDFPVGSVHFGAKTPSRTTGLGLVGEASYHVGLSNARGRNAVGPARAFLVQIGFVFDIQLAPKP